MGTNPATDEKTRADGAAGEGEGEAKPRQQKDPPGGTGSPAPGTRDRDGGVADEANYMNPKPEDEVAPGADRGKAKKK